MFTWFVCWCIKCTVYTNMVVNEVMEGDFRTRLPVKVFLKSPCSNCAKQTFVYGIIWCKDSNLHYGINVTKKLINPLHTRHLSPVPPRNTRENGCHFRDHTMCFENSFLITSTRLITIQIFTAVVNISNLHKLVVFFTILFKTCG